MVTAKILISACLLGQPVRYDGQGKRFEHDLLLRWQREGRLVPLCPEIAAGFPTPRAPAEIAPGVDAAQVLAGQGRVIDLDGQDVSQGFIDGAQLAVACARRAGCGFALLMDGSPSCGSSFVYSGHHDGQRRTGMGLTAQALRAAGVAVYAPDQIRALAARLSA